MSLSKVIEVAHGELGYTEAPANSNRTKYWEAYDPKMQGQPWCMAFLWWCFAEAGERMAFFGGGKTASCGTLLRWYREQGLTVPVENVQAGDIVLLNFNGKSTADHCGLVEFVLPGGWAVGIRTIEGNTSPSDGSQSNGGMVCEKTRYPAQIVGVCRPQYQPEPVAVDDITGHWAEDAIRWCIAHELMTGYEDGTWKPERPVTRAELATVLRRLVISD
ncbi:MAG: S-layer homology domain-containing protein [Firmicutes bacterium]|nr:S-layer homology domain-containing protein [Bacillota bacterium]